MMIRHYHEVTMNTRLLAGIVLVVLLGASCAHRDSSADARQVRRLAIDYGLPGLDSTSLRVTMVHEEVAVVTGTRVVMRPGRDTLLVPQMIVYVFKGGGWVRRLEG